MAKGISIKFKSYEDSIPKILNVIKLGNEIKKYDKIVLKPYLSGELATPVTFVEQVLKFCIENKNPVSEVFIVEGADGFNTLDLFDKFGYKKLAEKYSIGLIDLNEAETVEINGEFLKFPNIKYPKILLDSFIISLTKLGENPETEINGTLSNMLGAFPSRYYQGFFSNSKNKIKKWPLKFSIHDILKCKIPQLGIIDASEKGLILIGQPFSVDQQSTALLGKDWRSTYLNLLEESLNQKPKKENQDILVQA